MLCSIPEVNEWIAQGRRLILAGSDAALQQLRPGTWIGGTTPYFMDTAGGICDEEKIFVNAVPDCATAVEIRKYSVETLPNLCADAPENGYSFLLLPAGSAVHMEYAQDAPTYPGIFMKPVVGWVTGVPVAQIGHELPAVFDGESGEILEDQALVMHVTLPKGKVAELDIVNVFHQGEGDTITFAESGFETSQCLVNGQPQDFADYLAQKGIDVRLPLTADYNGSIVNVSIQMVDHDGHKVRFYGPVFKGVSYKFAAPVDDYVKAFARMVEGNERPPVFSCNCILNYLYAGLEGKKVGKDIGPITFGEVAHQLLNQTMVRLYLRDV